jgi:meso-butanediol dehydrogenase / (S,S)-butanediol dehydrogenase / diacetyl reductase
VSGAVLLTGGGTGIGAAVARRLVEDGYRVMISGRREAPLRDVAGELGCSWAASDTADPAQVGDLVARAVDELGGLDGLVCNAGISRSGTVVEQTPEGWADVLATNLTGAFLLCRAALPHLIERKGSIVAMSSLAALRAAPESAAYCVSKAGMVMLMQSIAVDYGPKGVRANAVCPGWVRTDMADGAMDEVAAMRGTDREGAYHRVHRLMPIPRPAETVEVAGLVSWLLSPAAGYVNGTAIPVDGGVSVLDLGLIEFGEDYA